jgi:D-alanyl-lipoteichoic acid acyltransferase DltB (MBOAT superfamily)
MLFNSFVFLWFFAVVYALHIALMRRYRLQNLMLLAASYVFYGAWDPRFLLLLFATSTVDWWVSVRIAEAATERRKKLLLAVSLASNLGVLGFFKYAGFFAENLAALLRALGAPVPPLALKIILPVGISFYTFQALSYTIDVYRGHLKPARSLLDFCLFVSLFPQLVAGPIERATHLLPQVERPREIRASEADAGVWLILWGYFKKVVVADNMALVANEIFNNHQQYSGIDLYIGALAFAGQIYGDFSGYSDIARGLCRIMGFDLMVNFRLPYFARDPSDFWRRWHVSLSTWLRDYLYVPLGGNRGGTLKTYRNLFLTMLLGGLWHGAAWNFVLWGAFHGLLLIAYRPFLGPLTASATGGPRVSRVLSATLQRAVMFQLTLIGWVLFRARSVEQIQSILFRVGVATSPKTGELSSTVLFFAAPVVIIEIAQHWSRDLLIVMKLPWAARALLYAVLLAGILILGVRESIEFIYFQF